MAIPSKLSEQIAFTTRPKIEEHMLVVIDKPTHEKHSSQPLQTNNRQFKIEITFLTGWNGIFNVTNSDIKLHFAKSITAKDGSIQITIPPGTFKIESLNIVIKKMINDGEHFTEANYPSTIEPIFSTLGSIVEIFKQ